MQLKIFFSLLIYTFILSPAWSGKEDYDISCQEHIFKGGSRKTVHVSRYTPEVLEDKNAPSIMFLHGGPNIKNEGQFESFFTFFTTHGYIVYVPEILGSSYYEERDKIINEYKQNFRSDIQAAFKDMQEKSSGKHYAIIHSLGCHQLIHTLCHSENDLKFEAVTAIAGAWDQGAKRLWHRLLRETPAAKDQLNVYKYNPYFLSSIQADSCTFDVGSQVQLERDEKPLTNIYNVVMNEELNKRFSSLYHIDRVKPNALPPIQVMHAKNDDQVAFSLSLDMFKALERYEHSVPGYFMSSGGHGFIKNPRESKEVDTMIDIRKKAAENILKFFNDPQAGRGTVYLDDSRLNNINEITVECEAIKEHKRFLELPISEELIKKGSEDFYNNLKKLK